MQFYLPDGSCNSHDDCANGSYCHSNKCVSSCENSLDCSSGVCTYTRVGSGVMKLCIEECTEASGSCRNGEICIGKRKFA